MKGTTPISLRDLLKYLDKESQVQVVTTFEDDLDHGGIKETDLIPTYGNLQGYKDRVESYVRQHNDHLVIRKLKTNKPITELEMSQLESILFDSDTVGTKQDYIDNYGDKPLGEFIRGIVGLDISAAQEAFAEFLQAGNLRADQMTFMNNIISYLTNNGTIEKKMLFEPPFTNIHDQGILGVFDDADAPLKLHITKLKLKQRAIGLLTLLLNPVMLMVANQYLVNCTVII